MLCLTQASDLEPSSETLTELKPVKQSVTYDNQTGKVYYYYYYIILLLLYLL